MADQPPPRGGGNSGMAFVLGAVVIVVAILAWFMLGGGLPRDEPDVSIQLPGGGRIEGEVEGEPDTPRDGGTVAPPAAN